MTDQGGQQAGNDAADRGERPLSFPRLERTSVGLQAAEAIKALILAVISSQEMHCPRNVISP